MAVDESDSIRIRRAGAAQPRGPCWRWRSRRTSDQVGDITSTATIPSHAEGSEIVARSSGVLAGLPVVERLAAEFELLPSWKSSGRRRSPGARDGGRAAGRPDAFAAGHGADGPELPPAAQRDRDLDRPVRRGDRRHPRGDLRHPQDDSRLAGAGEVRRPVRRRLQPPLRPLRRRPDQGQPPGLAPVARPRPGRPTRSPRRSPRRGPTSPPGRSSRSRSTRSNSSTSALRCGPDIILVDNLGPDGMAEAVRRRDAVAPAVQLEASGGVNLATVGGPGGHGRRPDQRRCADPLGPGAGPGDGLRHRAGPPHRDGGD